MSSLELPMYVGSNNEDDDNNSDIIEVFVIAKTSKSSESDYREEGNPSPVPLSGRRLRSGSTPPGKKTKTGPSPSKKTKTGPSPKPGKKKPISGTKMTPAPSKNEKVAPVSTVTPDKASEVKFSSDDESMGVSAESLSEKLAVKNLYMANKLRSTIPAAIAVCQRGLSRTDHQMIASCIDSLVGNQQWNEVVELDLPRAKALARLYCLAKADIPPPVEEYIQNKGAKTVDECVLRRDSLGYFGPCFPPKKLNLVVRQWIAENPGKKFRDHATLHDLYMLSKEYPTNWNDGQLAKNPIGASATSPTQPVFTIQSAQRLKESVFGNIGVAFPEQFKTKVHRYAIDTNQNRNNDTINGCTMISCLLALKHVRLTSLGALPDEVVIDILQDRAGSCCRDFRAGKKMSGHPFLVLGEVVSYLSDRHCYTPDEFVEHTTGSMLKLNDIQRFLGNFYDTKNEGKKMGAAFLFHGHVVSITKWQSPDHGGWCYDYIDTLPDKNGKTSRYKCVSVDALKCLLWYIASTALSAKEVWKSHHHTSDWELEELESDPAVFEAFIWATKTTSM